MTERAENNQWYRLKRPILIETARQMQALKNAVAARGFMRAPGPLVWMGTELELDAKLRLADANYQIASEAMDRDLNNQRHDYDMLAQAAETAWITASATLRAALEKELADLELEQARENQEVEWLAIEVLLRRLVITQTKAEIAIQRAALEQELAETERLTLGAEIALIEAKIKTYQKKVEIIPYLEALIEKEYEVLEAETELITLKQQYMEARQELVGKKSELIPYMQEKAAKLIELADATLAAIAFREQILQIALQRAIYKQTETDKNIDVMEVEQDVEDLRLELLQAQGVLAAFQAEVQLTLTGQRTTDSLSLTDLGVSTEDLIQAINVGVASSARDNRATIAREGYESQEQINIDSVDHQVDVIGKTTVYNAWSREDTAEISAKANITSSLVHLLTD